MHKFSLSLLSAATLLATSFASAGTLEIAKTNTSNPAINAHYSSSIAPKAVGLKAGLSYYTTDITIINASANVIYTVVPGAINDLTPPQSNDHILHPTYAGDTFIMLQDPNHATFFQAGVCRLAVVVVYGFPGAYTVKIDQSYCSRP